MAGSIQRLSDRPSPWRARYKAPDGRERSKSFKRRLDAERWLRHELADQDRGRWVDPRLGQVTFAEWSDTWLRGKTVEPTTRAGYESLLRTRVLPTFGGHQLRQITPAAVREWQTSMVEEGLGPARVRAARQVLRAALGQAVVDGLIARNPTDGVKAPKVRPRRQRFLTAYQVEQLASAAGKYGPMIRFLAWSGLRWSEAVALRWGSIDSSTRRVRVREKATEVRGRLVWGPPKTHEERVVLVPRFVLEELGESGDPEALVFTASRGGPLRASWFHQRIWRPAVEASGVPDDLVPHDLRDTAASLAIASGASIKAVQRMLGHASAAMTLDVYGGLFEDDLEALADAMEAYAAAHRGHKGGEILYFPR